jgi:plastocyanin
VSRCTAAADFDVQVDYSLLTWPAANGVRLGLRLIPAGGGPLSPGGQVERTSFGSTDYTGSPREVYLTFFAGETDGITAADGTSGKLRMVRAGDTMTGYYWSDGQWVLIHSGPGPTGAVSFGLAAWSFSGPFAQHRVRAAFDNFVVNQGQLDCAQVFLQRKQGSYLFSPRRAEVTVGTRVIWENGTATPDRIVSDTRGWKFDKKLRRGASVSFVFSRPGTYQYHSKAHPGMKARVVVAPAPSGSSAPEGGAL